MTKFKQYQKFLLVLVYAILAVLMTIIINTKGVIWGGDDMVYHVGRLISFKSSFQDGTIMPNISTSNFGMIGYGINLFYPWITLVPMVLISLVIHDPILAYYMGIGFFIFISFLISHYAMKRFSHSEKQAVIFSLIYGMANYRLIDIFSRADLAEYVAMIFLPIAFLGFYETFFRDYHKWPILAAGMSLLLMTHILTTVIVAFFFIIILIFCWWMANDYLARLKVTLAAIITSAMASAVFLIPFLSEILYQTYEKPSPYILKGKDTVRLLMSGLTNDAARSIDGNIYNIGIILSIALVLGLFFFFTFNKLYKSIYLLSLLSFVMVMKIFPWNIFQNTPVSIIQFPFRFLLIATLLISVVASQLFVQIFADNAKWARVSIPILGIIMLGLWYNSTNNALKTKYLTAHDQIVTEKSIAGKSIYEGYYEQYSPSTAQSYMKDIEGHVGLIDNQKVVFQPKTAGQLISFKLANVKQGTIIDLPIVKYRHSTAYLNGKPINVVKSKRGTIQIQTKRAYQHVTIKTGYRTGFLAWFSLALSALTWLWLLLELIYKE